MRRHDDKMVDATGVTVGVDISDTYSSLCFVDGDGQVLEEGKVRTTKAGLTRRFTTARCRVVLEVGTHSPWVSRLLAELGHEVIVANPRKVRLIAESDRKTRPSRRRAAGAPGTVGHLDRQPGRSRVKAFAVGAPAVLGGVLAIVWVSLNAERKRRRDG